MALDCVLLLALGLAGQSAAFTSKMGRAIVCVDSYQYIATAEALTVLGVRREAGIRGLVRVLRNTSDEMVALETLNIARALGVTGKIPKVVYDRACRTGKYPQRMAAEYPK